MRPSFTLLCALFVLHSSISNAAVLESEEQRQQLNQQLELRQIAAERLEIKNKIEAILNTVPKRDWDKPAIDNLSAAQQDEIEKLWDRGRVRCSKECY